VAIALDTSGSGVATGFAVGPRAVSYSHTCTGSNLLLAVWVAVWKDVAPTGTVSAATYNGVAMTKAVSATDSASMGGEMWYLIAPATGANTLSITVTGATDGIRVASASFTGVAQSSVVGNTNGAATGASGNPAITISNATSGSVLFSGLCRFANTAITATTWTNLVRANANNVTMTADYLITSTTGSNTNTQTGTAVQDWTMAAVEFKPVAGAPAANTSSFFAFF
jgi:DNA-binding transcriptional regulator YdaS (Cro superfamily)